MNTELTKGRKTTGWVLAGLLTAMLLFSAMGKFTMPVMIENFTKSGLDDWRIIIAIGEIMATLLFLLPKTNILGSFLLSSYFGGAILMHMTTGESIMVPTILLIVIWITTFVRNPELLAKFKS